VSEGLQGDDPTGPPVVQVPRVERNTDRVPDIVVPHHADKQREHVGCGHGPGPPTELGHQGCFGRLVELVIGADTAVPRQVESAVENVRADVGEEQDAVDPGGECSHIQLEPPRLERLIVALAEERSGEDMLLHENERLGQRLGEIVCGSSGRDRGDQPRVVHMRHVDSIDEENRQQDTCGRDQIVPAIRPPTETSAVHLSQFVPIQRTGQGTYPNFKFS